MFYGRNGKLYYIPDLYSHLSISSNAYCSTNCKLSIVNVDTTYNVFLDFFRVIFKKISPNQGQILSNNMMILKK